MSEGCEHKTRLVIYFLKNQTSFAQVNLSFCIKWKKAKKKKKFFRAEYEEFPWVTAECIQMSFKNPYDK